MPDSTIEKLKEICDQLKDIPDPPFQQGNIVYWKPGLKNKRFPRSDQPAIVVEVPNGKTEDPSKEPGSSYFKEPLDIILGMFDEDGDFITYYYDKRRFHRQSPT